MRISDWSSDVCSSDLEVVLADGATQNQACVLRKTDAGHDRTGRLLLDAVVDVDLIIRTWNLRRFYVHFLDEAQALETSLDRTSVGSGKRVSVRVALGGRRIIKNKTLKTRPHTK